MSKALGNNGGRFYSSLVRPVLMDCSFVVDSTNGNSLGIRSLKGSGVRNVFMHTTASFAGNTHTNTTIDGIASGTASLVVGMQLSGTGIAAGTKILSINSPSAITTNIATTATNTAVTISTVAPGSPNPASGFALVQLRNNYAKYIGGFSGFVSPSTGGTIAINGTALTVGNPYIIASVGHATAGTVTIAPVADVSGSLASTWFSLYDAYGNTFIIWFSVSGVGAAPKGVSGTLVQQSITTNDTAATIGADLVVTIEHLLAQTLLVPSAPAGVFSFTATGTTTITVVSTQTNPFGPLPGAPMDGLIPTGFTFANVDFNTNQQNWSAVGLLPGVPPNIGASFIATSTGSSVGGGSTGLVVAPGVSGITSLEVVGDPNQSIGPVPMGGSPHVGGWILVQFLAPTSSSVTTVIPTAPAQNSVVGMSFYLEESSVMISGE
jgi:hypothetical protein